MTRASTARNIRRGAAPQQVPPPQNVPDKQAAIARINAMMDGKESPPTPLTQRFLDKLKGAVKECEMADRNLTQAKANLKSLETLFERLQGRANAFSDLLEEALQEHEKQQQVLAEMEAIEAAAVEQEDEEEYVKRPEPAPEAVAASA